MNVIPEMNTNPRAVWFDQLCAFLLAQAEGLPALPRIPHEEYLSNDTEAKIKKLRMHASILLQLCGVDVKSGGNLPCFNHDDHHPSMAFYAKDGNFICFACRERRGETGENIEYHWDIIDIIGKLFHIPNFWGKLRKAEELLVEPMLNHSQPYQTVLTDPQVVELLLKKGITIPSMLKFDLKVWRLDDGTKYVVIPCTGRFVERKLMVKGIKEYPKSFKLKGVDVELFNGSRLAEPGVVFVVESALDAILLEQEGFFAVALNGKTPGALVRALYSRPLPEGLSLIILLDNDQDGRDAAVAVCDAIKKSGVSFYRFDYDAPPDSPQAFLHRKKDVGELMVLDKARTIAALEALVRSVQS